jgi:riboflavin biosynthesis pyrimidine reductase
MRQPAPAAVASLETLLATKRGTLLPLPPKLARLYGCLRLPLPRSHPHVISNLVSTLDGVVSLNVKGHASGGDISGFSAQDRMVMGLLRAIADVVIIGSGTLGADPRHVWTAEAIFPELADEYRRLRLALGKRGAPLNVIVSGSGGIDLGLPVFASGKVPALIVTTNAGARRLRRQSAPGSVEICAIRRSASAVRNNAGAIRHSASAVRNSASAIRHSASAVRNSASAIRHGASAISATAILDEVCRVSRDKLILVEGGPRLLGDFYAERRIDEQFLTLAPQIAGRDAGDRRLSLVMGKAFAPRDPLWGNLIDLRRGGGHLFLRYAFPASLRRQYTGRD